MHDKTAVGHFSAAFTVMIWGTTFISTKVLLREFTPIEILLFRFLIGFIALCIAYPHRLKISDRRQEALFAGAGLCGVTLYYLLENIALTFTTASNAGVIISIAPFFTALLASRFLDGEKPGVQFYAGFAAAITGIALIGVNGSAVLKLNPTGDILVMLAALIWGFYSVFTRKISIYGYNTVQTTRRIFFYGILFMLPATFFMDFRFAPERFSRPVNLLNILFLGVGASALCFVTWNYAVKLLGAVKTSVYIYIGPVVTIITSVIVLKETITWMAVAGTVLTLTGLVLSENRLPFQKKKAPDQENEPT